MSVADQTLELTVDVGFVVMPDPTEDLVPDEAQGSMQ
jgi:hypothetical protein